MDTTRHMVYPEAIVRPDVHGAWDVRDLDPGGPRMHFGKQEIIVPLRDWQCPCGHNHAEALRLHEMAHVAFTPSDDVTSRMTSDAELPHILVNAVEDARLTVRLREADITIGPGVCPESIPPRLASYVASGDIESLIVLLAASYASTETQDACETWIQSQSGTALWPFLMCCRCAMLELTRCVSAPTFADTIYTARELLFAGQNQSERVASEAERAASEEDADSELEDFVPEYGETPKRVEGDGLWGEMTLESAPLTRKARNDPERKYKHRDEGTAPTALHNLCSSGRVFKTSAKRGKGYAVLVDCSGSMSWDSDDLQALLRTMPATTVALYAGDGSSGVLRVVAHKGKRADDDWIRDPSCGDNTIDGPALRWLAGQRGKRVWVSDGEVTGPGSQRDLFADTIRIVEKAGIMRVDDADQAIRVVSGKERFTPSKGKECIGRY